MQWNCTHLCFRFACQSMKGHLKHTHTERKRDRSVQDAYSYQTGFIENSPDAMVGLLLDTQIEIEIHVATWHTSFNLLQIVFASRQFQSFKYDKTLIKIQAAFLTHANVFSTITKIIQMLYLSSAWVKQLLSWRLWSLFCILNTLRVLYKIFID